MSTGQAVVVWGEVLWDRFPDGDQLGGAPANVAWHLGQAGGWVQLVTRVGDDDDGHRALAQLSELVDTSLAQIDPERATGEVTVALIGGEPRYTLHPGRAWERIAFTDAVAQAVGEAGVLVFGTLAQRTTDGLQAWRAAARVARSTCLRVCDVNLRAHDQNAPAISDAIAAADIIKVNDRELATLASWLAWPDPIAALRDHGRRTVAVTHGADGSTLFGDRGAIEIAVTAPSGGDHVGCGDAYLAILVHGMTLGWDLATCGRAASRWAAAVAGVRGATPTFTDDQIVDLLEVPVFRLIALVVRLTGHLVQRSQAPRMPRAQPGPPGQAPVAAVASTEPLDGLDRLAAAASKHGALPVLGAITILMIVIYGNVFTGEVAGDDLTFHMAESARLADCLRHLDFDFWNPSANAGYASAYYYQVIPQMASAIPAALFGNHLFWFQLSVFLPLVLAPAAAYRGLRLVGATPWQAVLAAAAIGLMNGQSRWGAGNAGTFQVGLYTQTWALAGFPLALGCGARWISDGKGLPAAIAWGAFCGLCHPFAGVALGIALTFGVTAGGILIGTDYLFKALAPHDPPAGIVGEMTERWKTPPPRPIGAETIRLVILGGLLVIATMPGWITLLVDYDGFGGFPHRVNDEVGPGFVGLLDWHLRGQLLDYNHFRVLTWMLPIALVFARARFLRWIWTPALVYALLLGLGPHLGTTQDDLFPAVRFLGALQVTMALGIGSGMMIIGGYLWRIVDGTSFAYGVRTTIAAITAGLIVLVAVRGAADLRGRVMTMPDFTNGKRDQLLAVNDILKDQPPGRKQVGPGTENHWWNLLSYVYDRRPSLLQMGGGGLQASPNYDFLWTNRDYTKNAWLYDAPYLVFGASSKAAMPKGEDIGHTEDAMVRRLPTPGLVSPVQITGVLPAGRVAAKAAALAWIKTDLPLADHVLAYDGSGPAGDPPAGETLRAWHQDSPGDAADIVAVVKTQQPTTFMVRESWHPRWHAYIDGVEAPIRRVTPDFPAIDVPGRPGHEFTIALRFERPWWAQASWLAWPGVPFGAWVFFRRRERRRIPQARVVAT